MLSIWLSVTEATMIIAVAAEKPPMTASKASDWLSLPSGSASTKRSLGTFVPDSIWLPTQAITNTAVAIATRYRLKPTRAYFR